MNPSLLPTGMNPSLLPARMNPSLLPAGMNPSLLPHRIESIYSTPPEWIHLFYPAGMNPSLLPTGMDPSNPPCRNESIYLTLPEWIHLFHPTGMNPSIPSHRNESIYSTPPKWIHLFHPAGMNPSIQPLRAVGEASDVEEGNLRIQTGCTQFQNRLHIAFYSCDEKGFGEYIPKVSTDENSKFDVSWFCWWDFSSTVLGLFGVSSHTLFSASLKLGVVIC